MNGRFNRQMPSHATPNPARNAKLPKSCPAATLGFTLLETMLALMVFSIAVVSLVEAINSMGNASSEARRTREVQSQLEAMMLEGTRRPPQEIVSGQPSYENAVRREGVDYHLKMKVMDLSNGDGLKMPGIYSLSVTARWTDNGHKDEISADTVVYPPLYYVPH